MRWKRYKDFYVVLPYFVHAASGVHTWSLDVMIIKSISTPSNPETIYSIIYLYMGGSSLFNIMILSARAE